MGELLGADPDALDHLARTLATTGDDLSATRKRLDRPIHSTPWNGRDADRFRRSWDNEYGRAIVDAAAFLKEAGSELHRQADEQRHTSGDTPPRPSPPGVAPGGPGDAHDDGSNEDLLRALGLTEDAIRKVIDGGGQVAELLSFLKALLDDLGVDASDLGAFLDAFGEILDIAEVLADFLKDLSEHSHLPPDEAMLHAIIETALRFVAEQGLDAILKVLTQAIMNVVFPGAGAVAAWWISKGIGMLLAPVKKAILGAAEGSFDGIADTVVELYQKLKAGELDDLILGGLKDVGEGLWNFGKSTVGALNPFD